MVDYGSFAKHTIEDHLLLAAQELNFTIPSNVKDPKEAWRTLSKEVQYKIFKALADNNNLFRRSFPQHINVLGSLAEA